jgi:hypothetical protein
MFLGDLLWITQELPPGEGIFLYCNDSLMVLIWYVFHAVSVGHTPARASFRATAVLSTIAASTRSMTIGSMVAAITKTSITIHPMRVPSPSPQRCAASMMTNRTLLSTHTGQCA